ncbi:MAG: hypothetical protein FWC93_04695 [Defluviitaleaceae bacterium]|nr:hypothetical protein [Defluviitaleaceae bacterium]
MEGVADTLINSRAIDWRHPGASRFFADWFDVMHSAPDFNEDDWFMNVFHAMAQDGRLVVFPQAFGYEIVFVNGFVPGLVEAFEEYDFITISDINRLHNMLATDGRPHLMVNYSPYWAAMYNIRSFIDIEEYGWVDFNNDDFIQLIEETVAVSSAERNRFFGAPFFTGAHIFMAFHRGLEDNLSELAGTIFDYYLLHSFRRFQTPPLPIRLSTRRPCSYY